LESIVGLGEHVLANLRLASGDFSFQSAVRG
jgi:hypothetical protein